MKRAKISSDTDTTKQAKKIHYPRSASGAHVAYTLVDHQLGLDNIVVVDFRL